MNEEDKLLIQEDNQKEVEKLMKKSKKMIISFFTLFIICLVLFIVLQSNKFFIFNLDRDFASSANPELTMFFSTVFEIIVLIAFVIFVILTIRLIKRRRVSPDKEKEYYSTYKKIYSIADIFSVVPVFLLVVMVLNGFFFAFATVHQCSMYPTYCPGDQVIIKYVDEYNVGDVVIIENDGIFLIKRLVAKEGTMLTVDSTGVYFDGEIYVSYMGINDNFYYNNVEIPEGYYYCIGDNVENSEDSRMHGLFTEDQMIGVVVFDLTSSSTCTCP